MHERMFLRCIALSGNGFVYNYVPDNDVTYNDVTRMLTVRLNFTSPSSFLVLEGFRVYILFVC